MVDIDTHNVMTEIKCDTARGGCGAANTIIHGIGVHAFSVRGDHTCLSCKKELLQTGKVMNGFAR